MRTISRYGPMLLLALCTFVFASSAATPNPSTDDKQQVAKQSPDAQTAILAEQTFNVEGQLMGQLAVERLDADPQPIVLPDAPPFAVDHVPLY